MAQFASSNVLDNGINHIKNNAQRIVLLSAYTVGSTYATVITNILAEAATAPANYTLATSGSNRTVTSAAGLEDPSANATGTANHIAFLNDTGSDVLWVTSETSAQAITAGNPVTFPSLTYTAQQPTAV